MTETQMINDSQDAQILLQEQWSIELLSRETDVAIAKVQEVFLAEYKKLAMNAHIKSYLPLLACNSVRVILDARNAESRNALKQREDP
jgi:hypothetical protein